MTMQTPNPSYPIGGSQPPGAPPPRSGSKLPYCLLGCLGGGLFLLVLAVIGIVLAWPSLVSAGVSSDLTEYHTMIRDAKLAPEVQTDLLDRIERIREKARKHPPSLTKWTDYDESIRSLLKSGTLSPTELKSLQRELENLEAEFPAALTPEAEKAPPK